jgi:uncharacterized protein
MDVLIVPGWHGSGPTHWQSIWSRARDYKRLVQRDWENPDVGEWTAALEAHLHVAGSGGVTLIAHSLGCLTVARWVEGAPAVSLARVSGAFLVAPPCLELLAEKCPMLAGFRATEERLLPFASLVAASENDHYASMAQAQRMAEVWGSRFVNVGRGGHINVDSGHGEWPSGLALLDAFVSELEPRATR